MAKVRKQGQLIHHYSIPKSQLGPMLLSAFRYALGRQTYIVSMTVEWMIAYWDALAPWHEQIKADIAREFTYGLNKWDCDRADWQKILELPIASAEVQSRSSLKR